MREYQRSRHSSSLPPLRVRFCCIYVFIPCHRKYSRDFLVLYLGISHLLHVPVLSWYSHSPTIIFHINIFFLTHLPRLFNVVSSNFQIRYSKVSLKCVETTDRRWLNTHPISSKSQGTLGIIVSYKYFCFTSVTMGNFGLFGSFCCSPSTNLLKIFNLENIIFQVVGVYGAIPFLHSVTPC